MIVSKWLGLVNLTITLNVYGDYIPEGKTKGPRSLPGRRHPPRLARTPDRSNVIAFRRRSAGVA